MFTADDLILTQKMFDSGKSASAILRHFATSQKTVSPPELMKLLRDAFCLPYEATQCIGGWWYDGTGELSDEQIDAFIMPEIEKSIASS